MRRNISQIQDENNYDDLKPKSTKKQLIKIILLIIITIFIYYQIYSLVMYTLGKKDKEKMWLYNSVNTVIGTFISKNSNQTIENYKLKFAGLGDIYLTGDILKASKTGSSYNFTKGTENISENLKDYDLVVASLNTPIANLNLGYSYLTKYNTPSTIIDTLKALNISAVATATYHIMDKNEIGLTQTIESIKETNIEQTGISSENRSNPIIVTKNNITIGILSYTTKTNIKIASSKDYLVNILNEKNLNEDMSYLKQKNVDYIVAYLNTPDENVGITSSIQKENTELLFNTGVNVVLGTGTMIIQGQEEDQIDINGTKKHIYTIYSLGDFIGSFETEENRISAIANIEFTKKITKNKKGEVVNTVTDMLVKSPIGIWTNVTSSYEKKMYIISDEIDLYNNNKSKLTSKDYLKLQNANKIITDLYK